MSFVHISSLQYIFAQNAFSVLLRNYQSRKLKRSLSSLHTCVVWERLEILSRWPKGGCHALHITINVFLLQIWCRQRHVGCNENCTTLLPGNFWGWSSGDFWGWSRVTRTRWRDFRGMVGQGTGCLAPHKGSPNNHLGENTFFCGQCLQFVFLHLLHILFSIYKTMLCIPVSKLKDEIQ